MGPLARMTAWCVWIHEKALALTGMEKTPEQIREEEFRRVHLKLLKEGGLFTKVPTGSWNPLAGNQQVFVKLDSQNTKLEWNTLEMKNNKPADSGSVLILDK